MKFFNVFLVLLLSCGVEGLNLNLARAQVVGPDGRRPVVNAQPVLRQRPAGAGVVGPARGAANIAQQRRATDELREWLWDWLTENFDYQLLIGFAALFAVCHLVYDVAIAAFWMFMGLLWSIVTTIFEIDFSFFALFYDTFMAFFITGLYYFQQGLRNKRHTLQTMWRSDQYVEMLGKCGKLFVAGMIQGAKQVVRYCARPDGLRALPQQTQALAQRIPGQLNLAIAQCRNSMFRKPQQVQVVGN